MLRRALAALALALTLASCAAQECDFHSQCGAGFYCRFGRCEQDCRNDLDCDPGDPGEMCNALGQCVPAVDAGPIDAGPGPGDGGPTDAGPGPIDGGPGPVDGGPGPTDAGPIDAGPRDACT